MAMLPVRSERGAVLVHTSIAMIALLALSAYSTDSGVMLVSRRQAQNAADAASLAGALSLAFGDPGDVARLQAVAVTAAEQNPIWGQPPSIVPTHVAIVPCPAEISGPAETCVRADVYRNQARGNPLPTFFARLVGVEEQGVRATATAQVLRGNTATCTRPWAIPNRWLEARDAADEYDRYADDSGGPLTPPTPVDDSDPIGFRPDIDLGAQLTLTRGNPDAPITPAPPRLVRANEFFPIALDPVAVDDYGENVRTCHPDPISVGDVVTTKLVGEVPNPSEGVDDLIAQDAAAWDAAENRVVRACEPGCAGQSPRVVPVVLYDAEQFHQHRFAGGAGGGRYALVVKNITCLFVEQSGDVVGRLVSCPGTFDSAAATVDAAASFLRTVVLVR
jgi:Flp pilus assembly protein TadG